MSGLTPYMLDRLRQRELNQQKRVLVKNKWPFDFASNDYLGFARSPLLQERILQKMQTIDSIGATGSRLLTGNSALAEEVEEQIARFFGFEKALIFPCGFTLNCSLLAAFAEEHDSILMDENVHASLKNGLKLSPAPGYFFRHNDLNQLEARLSKQRSKRREIFVVLESLYSMDGDSLDLEEVLRLCEHYSARLIIDEAHAVGVLGDRGRGLVCDLSKQKETFAQVITFGKAFGCHGGALLGSRELIDYATNFCHSFIYTTGLAAYSYIAIGEALRLFEEDAKPFLDLHKKIGIFNRELGIEHKTPIYSFPFEDTDRLRHSARHLQELGFGILPIYSPTVRKGTERLRVSIHAHNTDSEIEMCARELRKFL